MKVPVPYIDPIPSPDANGIQESIDSVKASSVGGIVSFQPDTYTVNKTVNIIGDFHGGITLEINNHPIDSSLNMPVFQIGNIGDPPPEFRGNYTIVGANLNGPGIAQTSSVGYQLSAIADVHFNGGIVRNFYTGILGAGALICDFIGQTIRECFNCINFSQANGFSPNSLNFLRMRLITSNRIGIVRDNSNGVTNFGFSEFEGINPNGDAANALDLIDVGTHNFFGNHFENVLGSAAISFDGFDVGKTLNLYGNEIIAGADTQVKMVTGLCNVIGGRITAAGKQGISFAAGTGGFVANCEVTFVGSTAYVAALRWGKLSLGSGNNPVSGNGSPAFEIGAPLLASSGNIATSYSNDSIIENRYNTAGALTGAIQWNANGSHTLVNKNANGGWTLEANSVEVLFIGRGGVQRIEGGGDGITDVGSGSIRFFNGYIEQLRPGAGTVIWTSGAGVPNGNVIAPVGSLYTNTTGGAGTTFYVKETGTGNTGWVAK